MPEIDENEYAEWTRHKAVLERIGKSDEAKKYLQKAVLIGAPEYAGAEPRVRAENEAFQTEIKQTVTDFMDEIRKDREERKTAEERQRLESRWLAGRKTLRDAGYNDEGVEKIEKLMEDDGIADHEAAMLKYERLNPPPTPIATGNSRFNFFDQRDSGNLDLEKLMKGDDEGFLATAVPAAIRDVRGG